jgi:hypothetical protein
MYILCNESARCFLWTSWMSVGEWKHSSVPLYRQREMYWMVSFIPKVIYPQENSFYSLSGRLEGHKTGLDALE